MLYKKTEKIILMLLDKEIMEYESVEKYVDMLKTARENFLRHLRLQQKTKVV